MSIPPVAEIQILVTVEASHHSRLLELADQLRTRGLKDVQVLVTLGQITGTGPQSLLAQARRLSGVAAAEAADSLQIAPPNADIQ